MQQRKKAALKFGSNPFVLTTREEEVLQLIAEGLPNKGIAAQLGISVKTVEKHRQKVMDKLNIHETAGITRYAITQGAWFPKRCQSKCQQERAPRTMPTNKLSPTSSTPATDAHLDR